MDCDDTSELSHMRDELSDLRVDVAKLSLTKEDIAKLEIKVDAQSAKVDKVELSIVRQTLELSGIKKTILTIGAIISLSVAISTFYYEYILEKPSPVLLQKNIDELWVKYNKLVADRYQDLKNGSSSA